MLQPDYFRKADETSDDLFYTQPRLVVHIDDAAIAATTDLYREYIPAHSEVLDLMSSWRSHLPPDVYYERVTGLGMNEVELRENPRLTDFTVQNLNKNPRLPYRDATFDGCVCTVSVQYLTSPVAVFAEVARVLRPGAPFVVTFSNRMFPTKAVAIWQSLDDRGHQKLVELYFQQAEEFTDIEALDCSPAGNRPGDPLFAVVGRRRVEMSYE